MINPATTTASVARLACTPLSWNLSCTAAPWSQHTTRLHVSQHSMGVTAQRSQHSTAVAAHHTLAMKTTLVRKHVAAYGTCKVSLGWLAGVQSGLWPRRGCECTGRNGCVASWRQRHRCNV